MDAHGSFFADPKSWVAMCTVVFVGLAGKKIWSSLTDMLDARTNEVKAELDEASRLRQEAEAMLRDAQAQRDAALAEAEKLLAGAHAEAQRVAAAAQQEAEASAKRRARMALDRITAAEKAAMDEVRLAAADAATAAAQQVIQETLSHAADGRLVDQAIGQLPSALRAA